MRATRAVGPDALRLLGLVAIVVGHAIPDDRVREAVYPWHVAVFFFLAGYLWKPDRTLADEARRRWRSLLVPYLAWVAIIGLPLLAYDDLTSRATVGERLSSFVHGGTYLHNPFLAFWFLPALAVAALLYRALHALLGARGAQAASLLALPLTFVHDHIATVPWSVGVGAVAVFFVGAGHLVQQHRAWLPRLWPPALALGAALVASGLSTPLDMKAGDWGTPVLSFLVAALLSAGLLGLFEFAFRGGGPAWISRAASLGLVLVLTHAVPLYLTDYQLPRWALLASALGFGALMAYLARNRPALTGTRPAPAPAREPERELVDA
ncbi:acyltransferase family protein [Nocardioides aquiterrae]|uniref:Acyltransferase 3 domain-containing protein n=1 Tax=Nocardioides aquiterrae TaxID=203799 RepID=A0ABP4F4T9_9ACTN